MSPSGSPLTGARSLCQTSDVALRHRSCHVRACRGGCGLSTIVDGGSEWWRRVVTMVVGGNEQMMVVVEERGM